MVSAERRIIKTELRANRFPNGDRMQIDGYAATYNTPTRIGNLFHEQLLPGSFKKALARKDDVFALFNHNPENILGRTSSGTLRLAEDEKGLYFTASMPNTALGNEIFELISRGDLGECSFAFALEDPNDEQWDDNYDCGKAGCTLPMRYIRSVRLFDVSVVPMPAYPKTSVGLSYMEDLSKKSKIGQPDDQDTGELDGTDVKSGDDDDDDKDFDPTDYLSAIVPAEVRSRAKAHRSHLATGDPDAWFADASRRLDAADLDRADARRRQRAAAAGVLVENDSLRTAEDEHESRIADEDAIRATKRNVQLIRQPSTFRGTGPEYLEWLKKFINGF